MFRMQLASAGLLATTFLTASPMAAVLAGTGESCEREEAWATVLVPQMLGVVELTNEHRARLALGPLAQSRSLTRAALWKVAHMTALEYLDHDDPAPPVARTWDERVEDCGYPDVAGENIAAGYGTPEAVMEGWLDSDDHRDNIERPSYAAIGVGAAVADGRIFCVQVFGTQDDSAGDTHSTPSPSLDDIRVHEDDVGVVDVVANDVDQDGDPLAVTSLTQASNGQVTLDPQGTVRYRPEPDFFGEDRFSYEVVDIFGREATAEVTVSIEPVNDAPDAVDDLARVRAGRSVVIDVLANDTDIESFDDLSITGIVSKPARGSASVVPDARSITYRARRGSDGKTDRIVHEVSDGGGGTSRAAVTVTIRRAAP